MMPASQPIAFKNKLMEIINGWPIALVKFGLAVTFVWLVVLILFSLHLLQVV